MRPISENQIDAGEIVESIVGCKWSVAVLTALVSGVRRPSDLQRACEGISTKVLNERLRKLLRFGLAEKTIYAETPPRVEYRLTALGERMIPVLDAVRELQSELERANADR